MKILALILLGTAFAAAQQRTVVRVIDGDTVVLDQNETMRLIGIDAPEVASPRGKAQCFALRAAGELARLIEGKAVVVERDPQADPTDRYGRSLGYLYSAESGRMLNGEMVRRGFAKAYLRFPFRYADLFATYEKAAKGRKYGLWRHC